MFEKNKIIKLIPVFFAIDAFLSINPFFLWETYRMCGVFDAGKKIVEIGIILMCCYTYNWKTNTNRFLECVSFIVVYMYYVLDAFPGTLNIQIGIFIKGIVIILFLMQKKELQINTFKVFSIIFALCTIPGIVFCILNYLGINIPVDFIETTQEIKAISGQHYRHYFGCVFRESIYYVPRFKQVCGMFDEPGMLGTISALILSAEKYQIKRHKYLIFTFIGGALSMSFAFYMMVIIYAVLYAVQKKGLKKKSIIGIVISLIGVIALARTELIQRFILARMSFENLINNNRTSSEFDMLYSAFLNNGLMNRKVLFGLGNNNPVYYTVDASSYKVIIYNMGIIGFVLFVGWFLYWGIKNSSNNKKAILLTIIFMLSVYQRPWIMYMYCIVILFGGIEYINRSASDISEIKLNGGVICK